MSFTEVHIASQGFTNHFVKLAAIDSQRNNPLKNLDSHDSQEAGVQQLLLKDEYLIMSYELFSA